LKDFLPQQIPDARIMTFGYNAAATFGQSTSDVIDHVKSLLGSLVDKREEPKVHINENPQNTIKELTQWQEKNRSLIFIAHSLGEIMVK
jgi:hypothetical protein